MSNPSLIDGWRKHWNRSLLQFLRRRTRVSVDIEDLAQETYMRLLRTPNLVGVRNPQAYLLKVAGHVLHDWRERQPADHVLEPVDEDQLVDQCDLECDLDAKLTQQRLEHLLAQIPTVTRAVLILRFRDGMGRKDISQQLSLTDRQVRRHLVKGYEYLRESFTELK